MQQLIRGIFIFGISAVILACGLVSPRTPPISTETIGPSSLLPSSAPQPTIKPALPTQTVFSEPTPEELNPSGPYFLFSGSNGIWISNPDGRNLTQIASIESNGNDLHQAISPEGDRIALVVQSDTGLDLVEIQIPGGETRIITQLLAITPEELVSDPTGKKAFAYYAINQYNSVSWQPEDGRRLAFIGALNGPTADLYMYDSVTEEIVQLTDGPSQAILPSWSPDGQYILHYGVSWVPPFGGAIVGYNRLDGIWSVRTADEKVLALPKPKGTTTNFGGWQDDMHYLTYDSDDTCYSRNLRTVDVQTGESTSLMDHSFYYSPALSPENGAILFSGSAGCPDSPGDGVFLLKPDGEELIQISAKKAYEVSWMSESQVFYAYPEVLVTSDGAESFLPPVYDKSYEPAISINKYEAWEVIENFKGRVVVRTPGTDWRNVMEGVVDELIWNPISGETLIMAMQDGSIYAASFPDFEPKDIGDIPGGVNQAIWIR